MNLHKCNYDKYFESIEIENLNDLCIFMSEYVAVMGFSSHSSKPTNI